tara:strand:- start:427 stop:921 length:495 start_codon:yes stop_codon:yes gene_type:complete
MVELNLLNWRQKKNDYERQMIRRFVMLGVLVAVMMLGGVHALLNYVMYQRSQQVSILRSSLPRAEQHDERLPIAKNTQLFVSPLKLIAWLEVASLSSRYGVCYQRLLREDSQLTFEGKGWSLASVRAGFNHLEASTVFNTLKLSEIKKHAVDERLQFLLNASGG